MTISDNPSPLMETMLLLVHIKKMVQIIPILLRCCMFLAVPDDGDTWKVRKIYATDIGAGDQFGWSVAGGNYTIVSARFDDDNGEYTGSAYIIAPKYLLPNSININDSLGIGKSIPGYKLRIANETLNNNVQDLLCLETHTNVGGGEDGPAIVFDKDGLILAIIGIWRELLELNKVDMEVNYYFIQIMELV